jgi:hypothetical protein
MEHWHVRRGWVQFMGDCVATSFFSFDAFYMIFDTGSSHHLVWILSKMCFRGCVSLLYLYQPTSEGVPFGCILRATLHNMIDIDTLYCILYMFGFLMNTMRFCCCFVCVWGVVLQLVVCLQPPVYGFEYPVPYLWTYYFIFIVYVCFCLIVWYLGVSSCVLVHCRCHFIWVGLQVSV